MRSTITRGGIGGKRRTKASSSSSSTMRQTLEEIAPLMANRRSSKPMSTTTGLPFNNNNPTIEFSIKDVTDASAKRGFRVQVPKKMLFYVGCVFLLLPVILFGYVEVHRIGQAKRRSKMLRKQRHSTYPSQDGRISVPHLSNANDDDKVMDDEGDLMFPENVTFADLLADGLNEVAEAAKEDLEFLTHVMQTQPEVTTTTTTNETKGNDANVVDAFESTTTETGVTTTDGGAGEQDAALSEKKSDEADNDTTSETETATGVEEKTAEGTDQAINGEGTTGAGAVADGRATPPEEESNNHGRQR